MNPMRKMKTNPASQTHEARNVHGAEFGGSDCSPIPRPEDFGYEAIDGFGEHGSGGWQFEGGEEAYDAAVAVWEKANVQAETENGLGLGAPPCSRCAMLEIENQRLKEALDWQNMPNLRVPNRGGYEFYINEEWTCIRDAALGDGCGGVASLMKMRYDPDDERVRIRRVLDDDAILQELTEARESLARISSANALVTETQHKQQAAK